MFIPLSQIINQCTEFNTTMKSGTTIVVPLEQNIKMTVFAFWFDRNKELNYPFLSTRVTRGSRFFNDIHDPGQTTIVVPIKELTRVVNIILKNATRV